MRTVLAVSALLVLAATTAPVPAASPALTDPDAKRGFAQVQLIAKPGTPVETTVKNGDYEMYFKVDISKTENIARTKVVVKRTGQIVARQSSVVRLLQSAEKGYRPAQ